jgi:hypothetical protein
VRWAKIAYFSRLADHETFTRLAVVETQRRGTETAGQVVAVSDGALWLQEFVATHRPDAVRILDWPHAVGYVAAVAAAVYGADSLAAKAWLARQKETLLHGDPALLLTDLTQLQADLTAVAEGSRARLVWTLPGPHSADPPLHGVLGREDARHAAAVVDHSREYLHARLAQLQYAAFRAAHYPIGSGSVESANKLLVEARLKGAGRRWAPASVNPMVALRTVACNDRWAEAVPLIGAAQRRERQTATMQRRTARQAAEQVEQARLAAAARPSPTAATPAAPPPPAITSGRRQSRTPAPDHPWRHATLRHRRSA